MSSSYVDIWSYYDGALSGLIVVDKSMRVFMLKDDSDLDDRTYDTWVVKTAPTETQINDSKWKPEGAPTGSVSERDLYEHEMRF